MPGPCWGDPVLATLRRRERSLTTVASIPLSHVEHVSWNMSHTWLLETEHETLKFLTLIASDFRLSSVVVNDRQKSS